MPDVIERTGVVAGLATHWREAPASGRPPVLYVHGVPTASWDWNPYLERIGGVALDLPGFGTSAKPADFDYSLAGHALWLEAFTKAVGLERFSLVVHDWGGVVGLALAQRLQDELSDSSSTAMLPACPDITGTGLRDSGARRSWASFSWPRPQNGGSSSSRASPM